METIALRVDDWCMSMVVTSWASGTVGWCCLVSFFFSLPVSSLCDCRGLLLFCWWDFSEILWGLSIGETETVATEIRDELRSPFCSACLGLGSSFFIQSRYS